MSRRERVADVIQKHARTLALQAPPLTSEQQHRLRVLLNPPPHAAPKHNDRAVMKHATDIGGSKQPRLVTPVTDEPGALTPGPVTATAEKGPHPHDDTIRTS